MTQDERIAELAEIISKHHIGCNLPKDCNTKCDKCAAQAILGAGYTRPAEPAEDLVEAVRQERERIISYLQDILELSEKVKEPAIKVKMTHLLQALSSSLCQPKQTRQDTLREVGEWMKLHKAYLVYDESDPQEIGRLDKEWQSKLKGELPESIKESE